jgi:hypothetical protein
MPSKSKTQPSTTPIAYVLRDGLAALPGIGPGPLAEAEYEAREAAYMQQFEASAPTPRQRGIYIAVNASQEPQASPDAGEQPDAEPGEETPE